MKCHFKIKLAMDKEKNNDSVLRPQANWNELWFYQKAVVLYHLTCVFTRRFLPVYGDRTVDQMIQAARSGKQNIVEGLADGVASVEINFARGSIQELREDYEDYLHRHALGLWTASHSRYDAMLKYCRAHNKLEDYEPFFDKWSDEEIANVAITLAHMIDKMMVSHQERTEKEFVTDGGVRERMTRARLDYRNKNNKK